MISDDAARLETLLGEAVAAGIGREALLLRLSALPRDRALPHHLRLAREAVQPLLNADRARQFVLPNTDLVTIWRGPAEAAVRASLDAVARLFEADPAVPDPVSLARLLRLPRDAALLRGHVADSRAPAIQAPPSRTGSVKLDEAGLATLESALAQADMSRFARRRPICEWTGEALRTRWEERHVSVPELNATLLADHDWQADPWLFRRLRRTLDRRLLALLAAQGELAEAGPFLLRLAAASVSSPAFLRFDAALPLRLRGEVAIGFELADLLADPAAFTFARDFAAARDYRTVLWGIAPGLAKLVSADRAGVDLLAIPWSPELRLPDPGRTLLEGVDSHAAFAWGQGREWGCSWAGGSGGRKQERMFFFEKKNQKTSIY